MVVIRLSKGYKVGKLLKFLTSDLQKVKVQKGGLDKDPY